MPGTVETTDLGFEPKLFKEDREKDSDVEGACYSSAKVL